MPEPRWSRFRLPLPIWAKPSLRVDLLQLLAGVRPVVRTEYRPGADPSAVTAWGRNIGCHTIMDDERFVVFSPRGDLARRVMTVDRMTGRHTAELGLLLGYPRCCCRRAAAVGEEGLEEWAADLARRPFVGRFRWTHPGGYLAGFSWVSHVPCSPCCTASLQMACSAIMFALGHEV